jgi:hypothetical protein
MGRGLFVSTLLPLCVLGACGKNYGADQAGDAGVEASVDGATSDGGPGDAAPDDASSDASADADASADECDPQKPWGTPVLVAGLSNINAHPRLSADELTAYFSGQLDGSTNAELYRATRATTTAPFGPPSTMTEVSSTSDKLDPMVSANGLRLVFSLSAPAGQADLVTASRSTATGPFGGIGSPVVWNSGSDELTPYFRGPTDIYLVSKQSGAGDIYRAAGFVAPSEVAELNTASEELYPVVSADDNTILWSSRRADGVPQGGADIWEARRTNTASPFADLRRVTELNTSGNDTPTWLSESGCRLYFKGGLSDDVYMTTRPR